MSPFRLIYEAFPAAADMLDGVTMYENGKYVIMINKIKSADEQTQAVKHELSHILLGHFDNRTKGADMYLKNLAEVEDEADRYADQMTDEELAYLMTYRIG